MLDNEMFSYQLDLIKLAYTENTLIIGDLNLDFAKHLEMLSVFIVSYGSS